MKRLVLAMITIALVLCLTGCDSFARSKPEDAVMNLLQPESMSALLDAIIEDDTFWEKTDETSIYDRLYCSIDELPAWERFLRKNIKDIEYGISDVATREATASVTSIIVGTAGFGISLVLCANPLDGAFADFPMIERAAFGTANATR